ncbi:MAG: RloB family protein [Gallionella sp.]|nr:RloB family protein [Gallionella sp.]MDD4959779.1 RloB family protein [Gallionella sp.]
MAFTPKSRQPRFLPQPKVLLLCEDSKSGLKYFEDAARSHCFRIHRETLTIEHCGKTDPKGIVEKAVSRQAKFDKIYCVIDWDMRDALEGAIQHAKKTKKVEVISSYPCFEFWLLLHFGYTRKPYSTKGEESITKALSKKPNMEDYDKGDKANLFDLLFDKFPAARQNSAKVLADALNDASMNPSTEIHLLMNIFEKLSKPQPIIPK